MEFQEGYGYFKHLDIGLLKNYAKQWVDAFKDVKFLKIELRRYSPPRKFAGHYRSQPPTLYAIVFLTSEEGEDPLFSPSEGTVHIDQLTAASPFQNFVAATQHRQCVGPRRFETIIGNDFKKIYRMPPRDAYLDEWTFIPLAKDQNLPLAADNDTPPEILYSVDSVLSCDVSFQEDSGLHRKGKKSRKDYIQVEIEGICRTLNPENWDPSTVMKRLKERAGQPGSCIVSADHNMITWRGPAGDRKFYGKDLYDRLYRLHKKQKGQ